MKKIFLFLPLMFAVMFSTNKPMKSVKAEEAVSSEVVEQTSEQSTLSFIEKTYTYICDEGKIEITLMENWKARVVLYREGLEPLEMICDYTLYGNKLIMIANGTECELLLDDVTMTATEIVEEEPVVDDWKDKVENWKNTYIVPLISSVSITSILTMLFSVAVAYLNRKTNTFIKEANDKTQEITVKALEKVEEVKKLAGVYIDKTIEVLEKADQITNEVTKSIKKIKELTEKTENLIVLKQAVLSMCEGLSKIARASEELVKNGVAEELARIESEIKKIK